LTCAIQLNSQNSAKRLLCNIIHTSNDDALSKKSSHNQAYFNPQLGLARPLTSGIARQPLITRFGQLNSCQGFSLDSVPLGHRCSASHRKTMQRCQSLLPSGSWTQKRNKSLWQSCRAMWQCLLDTRWAESKIREERKGSDSLLDKRMIVPQAIGICKGFPPLTYPDANTHVKTY